MESLRAGQSGWIAPTLTFPGVFDYPEGKDSWGVIGNDARSQPVFWRGRSSWFIGHFTVTTLVSGMVEGLRAMDYMKRSGKRRLFWAHFIAPAVFVRLVPLSAINNESSLAACLANLVRCRCEQMHELPNDELMRLKRELMRLKRGLLPFKTAGHIRVVRMTCSCPPEVRRPVTIVVVAYVDRGDRPFTNKVSLL